MKLAAALLAADSDLATYLDGIFELANRSSNPNHAERWEAALLAPARDLLNRPAKAIRGRLVQLAFDLAGGPRDRLPAAVPVLVELLHAGSLIIDDIEDDSPLRRGDIAIHRRWGVPLALNTGNWLTFLPFGLVAELPVTDAVRNRLYADLSSALLNCHQGQALDLSVKVSETRRAELPEVVAEVTHLKTSSLMELAAGWGARLARADETTQRTLEQLGRGLGTGLQMLDDWSGIAVPARRQKGLEDLMGERPTWVWAWAASEFDDVHYAELLRELTAEDPLEKNQLIERLREGLAVTSRARIRTQLKDVLTQAQRNFPGSPHLFELESEIQQLERAYGERPDE